MLTRITHDHSLVQELVDAGRIAPEAAEAHPQANVITRAVGAADEEPFTLDKVSDHLAPGDRLLLCSDGLTKEISEAEIAAVLGGRGRTGGRTPDRRRPSRGRRATTSPWWWWT